MSSLNEIKKLIKIANDYDMMGDHKSADSVDAIIVSAFNKLGQEVPSQVVTGPETEVKGKTDAKLSDLKTGDSKTDAIFEGTSPPTSQNDLSNLSIGPRLTQKQLRGGTQGRPASGTISAKQKEEIKSKIVNEVAKKKRKKGKKTPMTDKEIDFALKEIENLSNIEEILGQPWSWEIKDAIKKQDKASSQIPYTQAEVSNLAKSINGKSIGWATVDNITLSGDRVTSVNLTLKSGKKVKYTPKTKTKTDQSALKLTVGDINKKLKKQLKV